MTPYEVRKEMRVAQYQWGLFRSELKKQEAKYIHWKENQKTNAEREGLVYFDIDALNEDYILGAIDEKTFKQQRKLYNRIIADCWQRAEKLEWLRENEAYYRRNYEALEALYQEKKREASRKSTAKHYRKVTGIKKRTYDSTKRRSKNNQPYTGKRRWEIKAEREAALAAEQEKASESGD